MFYTRSSHRLISFFWGIFSLSFSAQSFKSGERVFVRFFKNTVQHNLIVSFFCHRLDQRVWRVFFFSFTCKCYSRTHWKLRYFSPVCLASNFIQMVTNNHKIKTFLCVTKNKHFHNKYRGERGGNLILSITLQMHKLCKFSLFVFFYCFPFHRIRLVVFFLLVFCFVFSKYHFHTSS